MALLLGLLIFSFVITGLLIVPFIGILYKLKFTRRVEAPKKRRKLLFDRLHDWKAGTPVGGGILIIAVVSVLFILLFPILSYLGVHVTTAYPLAEELRVIFLAFVGFGLLGLYDDLVKFFGKPQARQIGYLFGLRARWKFLLQWAIALVIGYWLWQRLAIDIVHIPLIDYVVHLEWIYTIFAAFVIVSFTNAVNITDGLDGLAAGLLLICLFAFWIVASATLDTPLAVFISLWIGALFAFLYFNIWPARIFMGDTGALSFGATIAVIGLLLGKIFVLFIIGGVFLAELLSSFIQLSSRKFFKRRVFAIAPFHLLLQSRDWEEPKIVMRAWLAGAMLAIFGLWLAVI